MASERILKVAFVGDASSATRAARQVDSAMGSIDGSAQKTSGRFGRSMAAMGGFARSHGRSIASGLGLAAAAVAGAGVREAIEAEQVMAQTEARLESTGKAANVQADEVVNLAGKLSALSGVDDELVQSSENVLLTFTRVRNEMGKGNDIFNQGTKAALNMSVAMEQDLQSATLMVGKALNDPVKGMTALTRAGVQFTDEQKATITTLVESGQVMKAQKVILEELETQFGGAAEAAGKTMGGSLNRLKNSFEEVAGTIAEGFKPQIKSAANAMQSYAELAGEAFQADERRAESHKSSITLMAELAKGVEAGTVSQAQYTANLYNLINAEGQSIVEKERLRAVAAVLTSALRDGIPITTALTNAFGQMGAELAGTTSNVIRFKGEWLSAADAINNAPIRAAIQHGVGGGGSPGGGGSSSGGSGGGGGGGGSTPDTTAGNPLSFQSSPRIVNNTFLVLNESQKRQLKRELDGAGMRDDLVMGR
jgi:hypothetical protein